MTRVLVTGGAGYLGSILCEHLVAAGHSVTVLDSLQHGGAALFHLGASPSFDFVRGDARDETVLRRLLARHDVIVPLAAIVGASACDRDPLMAESVNVGAIRLLDRLRSPEQLVVFPNTNSGYGTRSEPGLCTEDTPLEPISLYGRTKVRAEAELLGRPRVASLRLATVFGLSPRMRLDLLVNHFVHVAVTQGYLVLFEAHFRRNFVHVRDVADAFLHVIANAEAMSGRSYNVGLDDANLTKAELAERVRAQVPDFHVTQAEIGRDPDRRDYVVSHERLRAAGFVARRGLDDGIRELIKGFAMLPR
ncbi:MAG TPA: NAD(P)-dependent oxidoreductase, partial [Vicinamibacteria bacterium]|nr:NAD(P)-dependent oxidoreductase [Vicinamibacteria bacterium]